VTLDELRSRGLTVEGELGDYRPLVALDNAMREFRPDHVVIATQPEERSTWLRHGVVADARDRYDVTIQHVVVHAPVAG
jgi:GABA permease